MTSFPLTKLLCVAEATAACHPPILFEPHSHPSFSRVVAHEQGQGSSKCRRIVIALIMLRIFTALSAQVSEDIISLLLTSDRALHESSAR